MNEKTKLVIVDDHSIVIDGLELLLSLENHLLLLQSYLDGNNFIQDLRANKIAPTIVLMDLLMPNISGLDCAKIIKKEFPEIKIIILSMELETKNINQLINKIGVEGYLNKTVRRKELLDCIALVEKGYIYLSKEAEFVLENYREKLIKNDEIKLSAREKEIIGLMIIGNTNAEIANKLFIAESTVETHRKNIYRKTDTHSVPKLNLLVNELELLK
ncbi:MAG: response regulator transcription factor [Bacteroidetes bacterium]|nr:response regulator transcription factor [Bacteroidota bacterium]